jgi:hypothetical protein
MLGGGAGARGGEEGGVARAKGARRLVSLLLGGSGPCARPAHHRRRASIAVEIHPVLGEYC